MLCPFCEGAASKLGCSHCGARFVDLEASNKKAREQTLRALVNHGLIEEHTPELEEAPGSGSNVSTVWEVSTPSARFEEIKEMWKNEVRNELKSELARTDLKEFEDKLFDQPRLVKRQREPEDGEWCSIDFDCWLIAALGDAEFVAFTLYLSELHRWGVVRADETAIELERWFPTLAEVIGKAGIES